MRIGFVTQWYEPETGSAAHPTAIARALHQRGHQMKVLTGFPSYPLGRVYPGFRMRLRQDEVRDGIRVRRVPDFPSHDDNAVRRALSLTSFAASATSAVRWLSDSDVVLTYLSPATVGFAPWLLQRMAGVPYVLYVQDLWPETITASQFIANRSVNRRVEAALNTLLRRLYEQAGGVIGISPSMTSTLAGRGARTAPVCIPNWVDDVFTPARPGDTSDVKWDDRTWIMYAGGMGEIQCLDNAIRAIALLADRPDIGLVFVGDGVAREGLRRLTDDLRLEDRVQFLGSRPMSEMPALMAETAAQLVSLRDLPVFRGTIPSKIQASMACGAPVICAVAGDAADLVRSADAGLVVEPENPAALAAAFRVIADMGEGERRAVGARGAAHYERELSSAAGSRRLEQVLFDAKTKRGS